MRDLFAILVDDCDHFSSLARLRTSELFFLDMHLGDTGLKTVL